MREVEAVMNIPPRGQFAQLTVGQLREMLGRLPQDALVILEGCDCYGKCCGAEMEGQTALLRRRDGAGHVEGDGYGDDHEYEGSAE